MGRYAFSQWGDGKKNSVKIFANLFLKILTEGTEMGGFFQYFATLIENAGPLLWRWPAPWSTLLGYPLRPH